VQALLEPLARRERRSSLGFSGETPLPNEPMKLVAWHAPEGRGLGNQARAIKQG
jgi:hypothetical protein